MFRTILPAGLALFLSIALDGAASAGLTFQTPAGISPGQSFNVVFYDSLGNSATSSNIADYNAAITSAASGIQYSGGTIGAWSIIGATRAADKSAGLFGSSLPVYDLRGNLLAATGGVYQSIGFSPSVDQTGALFLDYPAWTGLIRLGIPGNSQYTLGGRLLPLVWIVRKLTPRGRVGRLAGRPGRLLPSRYTRTLRLRGLHCVPVRSARAQHRRAGVRGARECNGRPGDEASQGRNASTNRLPSSPPVTS